ncbi:MAG: ROK family protein [Clostridia bacterium]|nr:ROK family protein [Clostridia bacterium]
MYTIGIDLGGTNIEAGLVDKTGHIEARCACQTAPERGARAVIQDMIALAHAMLGAAAEKGIFVSAIGVGTPGVVDKTGTTVTFANNLGWQGVNVAEPMRNALGLPVVLENDATAACIAEWRLGALRGEQEALFITLGTGVGGCFLVGGRPYTGAFGAAGEVGHMVVDRQGPLCSCGRHGCWEMLASAPALARMGRQSAAANETSLLHVLSGGDPARIDGAVISRAAAQGDEAAQAVWARYIDALVLGLENLNMLLNPTAICLAGGVTRAGAQLLEPLQNRFERERVYTELPMPRLCLTALPKDTGILGAAMVGQR